MQLAFNYIRLIRRIARQLIFCEAAVPISVWTLHPVATTLAHWSGTFFVELQPDKNQTRIV